MALEEIHFRDRKGTPKNLCDKEFAELSGELSGVICLKTLVLLEISPNFWVNFLARFASKPLFYWVAPSNSSENSLVLFVRFWLWSSFLALDILCRFHSAYVPH